MVLNPKQERFVEEYLVDLNASQAAVRAGYSAKTAKQQGQRLLTVVDVSAAIQARKIEKAYATKLTAERVLLELGRIGLNDPRKIFGPNGTILPPEQWDDDTAAAISSIEVVTKASGTDDAGNKIVDHVHRVRFWDKNSALDKIGKHMALFIERHEHTGKDGGPIELAVSAKDLTDDELATIARGGRAGAHEAAAGEGKPDRVQPGDRHSGQARGRGERGD